MIVQEFIDEVSRRLRDVSKKQWDNEFLINATNAALAALTTTMPQAFTVNRNLTLVGGTEQIIDDDLHKIVSILHNVSNVDGSAKRAITKAELSIFDAVYPQWRQDPSREYIRHWMVDEVDESKFYVWPPAPTEDPLSIRGTFTRTPYISRTVLPEVPDEPIEPVDPGELGSGGDPYPLMKGYFGRSSLTGGTNMYFERTDGGPTVDMDEYVAQDTLIAVQVMNTPDTGGGSQGAMTASRGVAFAEGTGELPPVVSGNVVIRDTANQQLRSDDARIVLGQIMLVRIDGVSTSNYTVEDYNATYNQGTTQQEVDAYQADLTAYNALLAEYNAAQAALEAYIEDESEVRVDDELPVKRAHIPALQEFTMYYAYSVDDDMTANSGRAQRHWLAFFQMLNKREDSNLQILERQELTE